MNENQEQEPSKLKEILVEDSEAQADPVDLLIEAIEDTTFETKLWEKPITIKDKGVDLKCVIRELSQELREEYTNLQTQKAKFGPDGRVTGVKDIKGLETKLIHMGLFGPDGNNVPEAVIKKWSGSLTKKLAQIIARVSALDDGAEKRAKNS